MTSAVLERACEYCGGLIPPDKRSDARYCSPAHRAAAARERTNPYANRTRTDNQLATVTPIRAEPALTWEPAAASFGDPYQVDERCPDCGRQLWAEPCGTWLACLVCKFPVAPAAVAAAYDQGAGEVQRSAATEPDRDRADVILSARKDQLLLRVAASGLPAGSELAKRLDGKIRAARSGHRLSQLAGLLDEVLPGAAEQRLSHPPVTKMPPGGENVTAECDSQNAEGEIVEGEIVDDDGDDATYLTVNGRLVLAEWTPDGRLIPAQAPAITAPRPAIAAPRPAIAAAGRSQAPARREMTWLEALDVARRWLDPLTPPGRCPVSGPGGTCGRDAAQPIGERTFVCYDDQQMLARIIKRGGRLA